MMGTFRMDDDRQHKATSRSMEDHVEQKLKQKEVQQQHNIINAKYGINASDAMTRLTFDTLLELQGKESQTRSQMSITQAKQVLRLCGGAGGENSGNGSGWGSPPTGSAGVPNPNIVGSWGSAVGGGGAGQSVGGAPQLQQPQPQAPGQQVVNPIAAQVSGGPPGGNNNNNNPQGPLQPQQLPGTGLNAPPNQPQQPQVPGVVGGVVGVPAVVPPTTKHQLEQLNTMRDALFAMDGWGCQHVNQDTNWEVPSSPDLKGADVGWKPCTANNGTELWEHNLRNGGQPPAPPVQKTPWGHTPSTNLGGTWGEDDDSADTANVWTGTPTNPQPPQWGNNAGPSGVAPPVAPVAGVGAGVGPGAPGMWPNANPPVKKEGDWSGPAPTGGNWAGNPLGGEAREMRAPSADPRMIDPRDQLRGDPRGISGRLNGSTELWGQHHGLGQHGQMGLNKMPGAPGGNGGNGGQWGGGSTLPKDIPVPKQSGWEEPSPPNQRRPFEDGTTLWGQRQPPQQQLRLPGAGGGQWKDSADPRNLLRANSSGVTGGPAPQMPPNRGGPLGLKQDGGWGPNGGRNGTPWEDGGNHGMSWDDKLGGVGTGGGVGSQWGDSSGGGGGGSGGVWNKNKAGPMWPEGGDMSDWGHNPGKDVSKMPPSGGNNVDLMRTEPYRILYQMGYKKEEIEHSLRANNLNFDEALEMLKQRGNSIDSWGRHDDHGGNFDQFPGGGRFPGGGVGQQPPSQFPPNNSLSNILGNSGAGSGISPNFVAAMQHPLSNMPFKQPPPPAAAGNQGGAGQPSTLRMLVQQIKMAVQAGYLNPQILNQPLAPQTLVLLNQLLNLIKQLQMTNMNAAAGRGNVNSMQAATKFKQQISNLQNQISAQQAIYIKQQQQQQQPPQQQNPHVDFLRNHQDPIVPLQSNFSDMALNKDQHNPFPNTSQQSRLNQWKLPNTLPSDDSNDFGKSAAVLGLQNEGPWSSGRNVTDGWPDSNADSENKDWPNASQPSPGSAFTDLVAEFEPGKPWKGSQMKNIEDDPSITPGSVARSPLSISAAKENDLFGGMSSKTSPSDLSLNLSSSTWSYPNKLNNPTTPSGGGASELWGSGGGNPMAKGSRNPPPGLGGNGSNASTVSNGWSAGGNSSGGLSRSISGSGGGGSSAWSGNSGNNWGTPSNWLLLKNLTTQIDGSTLRTLCMQHGPLQHFHLYLNNSIALCKYSTMEVAQKAQMALNNCVLGNTTICAESPSENEVQNILLHLGAPGAVTPVSSGQAPSWRPGQQGSRNSGNAAWPSSTGQNSLWGAPLEGGGVGAGANVASERGTPSNLNSFLPENLLGGELN